MPTIDIAIDPRKAQTGGRQVERSLDKIQDETRQATRAVDRFGDETQRSMRQATRATDRFQRSVRATGAGLARLRTAAVAMIGVLGVRRLLQFGDELGKVSANLGITVEQLQELQFAASQTGTSTEKFNKSFTRFIELIGQARQGRGTGLEAFRQLGIDLDFANGEAKDSLTLFRQVTAAITGLSDQSERAAVAQDLFGRNSRTLINLLQQGVPVLDALALRLRQEGGLASQDSIDKVQAFNDQIDIFVRTVGVDLIESLSEILPILQDILSLLLRIQRAAVNAFKDMLSGARAVGGGLARFFGITPDQLQAIKETFGQFFDPGASDATLADVAIRQRAPTRIGPIDIVGNQFTDVAVPGMAEVEAAVNSYNDALAESTIHILKLRPEMQRLAEQSKDIFNALRVAGQVAFVNLGDAVEEFITTGKVSFQSFVNSVLSDMTRIATNRIFQQLFSEKQPASIADRPGGFLLPLISAVAGAAGGAGGGTTGGTSTVQPILLQGGGMVPGPRGKPRLITAHGGETVTPAGRGGGGNTITMTFNIATPDVRGFARNERQIQQRIGEATRRTLERNGTTG